MSLKSRLSFKTANLSSVLLMSMLSALLALLIYTGVIPKAFFDGREWPWFLCAFAAVTGVITVILRLLAGEKWS